ncbi:SDR family oxidoreductase [Tabrizicola sp.]|uniref:SDR family oxidoreductase n=1 Tax=Tabrizicola sp. TaxID=2005166 RepID=UPI001A50B165|nr:SDR family oxidoreductase [Tabrizicola sp.]MBL9075475.1 SDR family oxidoreductase [Tabrizicola sp.]
MTEVLVTGATSGIGRAMARTLHAAGYRVLALGRNAKALAELAAEGIEILALDLADLRALSALQGRPIDVLVNNAGIMPKPGPFAEMSAVEIDQTLAVNLASVLHLTQAIVPGMIARGAGHVVFTGSTAAHAPGANFAAYAASKAGIAAFATALRAEISPHGIRVTELVPGRVETGLYSAVLPDSARGDMYANGNSLQPQDLADALLAVLSLPPRATVTRLDILPTRPVPAIRLK